MKRIVLLLCISSLALFGECEPQGDLDETKLEALKLYESAETLYDARNFAQAYTSLTESFGLYSANEMTLYVNYNCIKLVPGPYAPKRTRYESQKEHDFDRSGLGNKIKAYLTPKPLIVVQFIDDSSSIIPKILKKDNLTAKVTVVNYPRSKRETINNQLALEEFSVSINGQSVAYDSDIKSGEQKSKTFPTTLSYKDISVDSSERYGYKTFSKDW